MVATPNVLNRIRDFAYRFWVLSIRSAIQILLFLSLALSFVVILRPIQAAQYGVLIFAGVLFGVVCFLYRIFDRYADLRPPDYADRHLRIFICAAAFVIPIGVSWIKNETLYGALNPVGYWKDELVSAYQGCSTSLELLQRSVEEFRVVDRKFDMGIATSYEFKASAENLKMFRKMHFECVSSMENRRAKVREKLSELESS